MKAACRLKYEHVGNPEDLGPLGPRATFLSATETRRYIDEMSVPFIANGLQATAETKAHATDMPGEEPQSISVRDFVIDGPTLATNSARVKLTGYYILEGGIDTLYADAQSLILGTRTSQMQPKVGLQVDGATHQLREKLLNCQTNPSLSQLGCSLSIEGEASICRLTNAFGAEREMPCVVVSDGH